MPHQFDTILGSGRVQLVVGDVTETNLGLEPAMLAELAEQVTLIIHSAANVNLTASLRQTVGTNTLPTLRLAKLAVSRFLNLKTFLFVSAAYVNVFLPDRLVEENIYELGDPEHHLAEILTTGSFSHHGSPQSIWPYTFGSTLLNSCFCPGTRSYPSSFYMKAPNSRVFGMAPRHITGANTVDEIPVDLVANLLLLHAARGTRGIVHASSQSYVARTLVELYSTITPHFQTLHPNQPMPLPFRYVTDVGSKAGYNSWFWDFIGRDWHFSNAASRELTDAKGVLSMWSEGHDVTAFMVMRVTLIARELVARSESGSKL
ncbi:male sterility protein-domain-containing protein [Mycena filopes]|nr:male sterility protein-domain-containing protein [Mycena filopes]